MNNRNRIQDPRILRERHGHQCEIEGCQKPGEVHHIIPRSRLGPDLPWNLMNLCSRHHIGEWHGKGVKFMIETYPDLIENLRARGFEYEIVFGKAFLFKPDWDL